MNQIDPRQLRLTENGHWISLDTKIGGGGGGAVFSIKGDADHVVKLCPASTPGYVEWVWAGVDAGAGELAQRL